MRSTSFHFVYLVKPQKILFLILLGCDHEHQYYPDLFFVVLVRVAVLFDVPFQSVAVPIVVAAIEIVAPFVAEPPFVVVPIRVAVPSGAEVPVVAAPIRVVVPSDAEFVAASHTVFSFLAPVSFPLVSLILPPVSTFQTLESLVFSSLPQSSSTLVASVSLPQL